MLALAGCGGDDEDIAAFCDKVDEIRAAPIRSPGSRATTSSGARRPSRRPRACSVGRGRRAGGDPGDVEEAQTFFDDFVAAARTPTAPRTSSRSRRTSRTGPGLRGDQHPPRGVHERELRRRGGLDPEATLGRRRRRRRAAASAAALVELAGATRRRAGDRPGPRPARRRSGRLLERRRARSRRRKSESQSAAARSRSRPGRGAEQRLELVALDLLGLRQELEDPAALVVEDDDSHRRRGIAPGAAGRSGRGGGRGRR